jgi:hypothetical protein
MAAGRLAPGQSYCPLHWHTREEELFIVWEGNPTLRTPAASRRLNPGDCIVFATDPRGAHRVSNETDASCTILMIANRDAGDVCFYPDSRKLLVEATGTLDPLSSISASVILSSCPRNQGLRARPGAPIFSTPAAMTGSAGGHSLLQTERVKEFWYREYVVAVTASCGYTRAELCGSRRDKRREHDHSANHRKARLSGEKQQKREAHPECDE